MIDYSGKTLTITGDSVGQGLNASSNANRWTTLLCGYLNAIEDNQAIGGTVLQTGVTGRTPFNINNVQTKTGSISAVILAYGINDIDQGGTLSGFVSSLDADISAIIAKGYLAAEIIILSSYWFTSQSGKSEAYIESFVNAALSGANTRGCIGVDVYTSFKNLASRSSYMSDAYHANNAGHLFIANTVYSALLAVADVITIKGRRSNIV